jgi:hypothetical protein
MLYNEKYVSLPMSHKISTFDTGLAVGYEWKSGRRWNRINLTVRGSPALPKVGSEEQFITEHYWGYASQPDGGSVEYQVAHPPWRVWGAPDARFEGDMEELYAKISPRC